MESATQEKFLSEMLIIVKKKAKVELVLDEGWYSIQEMKDDLKWKQQLVLVHLLLHCCAQGKGSTVLWSIAGFWARAT